MKKKNATIQDIAEELDVTASTVSRALQDHPRISDATKKSVRKIAEKLNYQPNNIAAALRKGRSNIIGIIIPRVDRYFFATVLRGVEDAINGSGFKIIISQTHDSTKKEKSSIAALLEAQVDGILTSYALKTKKFDHYNEIIDRNIPLILFDRGHESLEPLQSGAVILDDYLGSFNATKHLINQGCSRIVHFSGPQHVSIYKERQRGYEEALKRNGLPIEEDLIMESNVSLQAGKELGSRLLQQDELPDAIFSASDYSAAAAMEILKEHGIKIPEDIAIVGFGNEPLTSFLKLSSVDQHPEEMGRIAAQLFLNRAEDGNTRQTQNKTVLNPELIVRNSSLKKKKEPDPQTRSV